MSYFCQFCDKELMFEQSIVYQNEYITCGNASCIAKAKQTSSDIAHEYAMKTAKLLIFKSSTPNDSSTWRIVPKKEYPEFIREEEVLRGLFDGYVISMLPKDETQPEVFYCARNTEEVLRQIAKEQQVAGAV